MASIGKSHGSSTADLDSRLLQAFVAVAESGGFTTAAQHLHKTQSTISLRINTLETRLSTQLFQRSSRTLALTADGQTFLVYARRLLQLQREAISAVNPAAQPMMLRFGLPEDYAEAWIDGVLRAFRAAYPAVRPHIHCGMSTDLLAQLDAGALDLALTVRHSDASTGRQVGREQLLWAAHPAFELADRQTIPLALFPEQCVYRHQALAALTKNGQSWHIEYTSQSPVGLRVAVNQGHAVTVTGRRTLPVTWRVLGEDSGLPPLAAAVLEIHRAPTLQHPAFSAFTRLVEQALGDVDTPAIRNDCPQPGEQPNR